MGRFEEGESMYIEIPQGFEQYYDDDEVLLLLQTIYGCKQAAMAYYKELVKVNEMVGLIRSKADPCLFYKWIDGKLVLNTSWVDDLLYGGNEQLVELTMKEFTSIMDCDVVGDAVEYIGCKVDHDREGGKLKITQPVLIQSLIDKFEFAQSKRFIRTPAVAGSVLEQPTDGEPVLSDEEQSVYRSAQGINMYLVGCSRLECGNAVREMARQNAKAGLPAFEQLKRTVQHLVCTKDRAVGSSLKLLNGEANCTCPMALIAPTTIEAPLAVERKSNCGWMGVQRGGGSVSIGIQAQTSTETPRRAL